MAICDSVKKIFFPSRPHQIHPHWSRYIYKGTTEHNREEEVINMLQKDSIDEEDKTKLW